MQAGGEPLSILLAPTGRYSGVPAKLLRPVGAIVGVGCRVRRLPPAVIDIAPRRGGFAYDCGSDGLFYSGTAKCQAILRTEINITPFASLGYVHNGVLHRCRIS